MDTRNTSRNGEEVQKDLLLVNHIINEFTEYEVLQQTDDNDGKVVKCSLPKFEIPDVQFFSKPVQNNHNEDLDNKLQSTRVLIINGGSQQSNEEAQVNFADALASLALRKRIWWILCSIGAYIIDVGSDVFLAVNYYREEEYLNCSLTALFVYLPVLLLLLLVISDWFGRRDKMKDYGDIILAILLVFPIKELLVELHIAVKYYRAKHNEDNSGITKYREEMEAIEKVNKMLKMLQSILECAPQLILQLAITLSEKSPSGLQIFSIVTSFLAMTEYNVTFLSRKDNGLLDHIKIFFSCFFMIMSRTLSISAVASVLPTAAVLGCTFHIIVVTILQILYRYSANPKITINTAADDFINGLFSVPNPNITTASDHFPINSKINYYTYHVICFVENFLAVTEWAMLTYHTNSHSWYYIPVLLLSTVLYIIGIIYNHLLYLIK